jgi:hypothetical protein
MIILLTKIPGAYGVVIIIIMCFRSHSLTNYENDFID